MSNASSGWPFDAKMIELPRTEYGLSFVSASYDTPKPDPDLVHDLGNLTATGVLLDEIRHGGAPLVRIGNGAFSSVPVVEAGDVDDANFGCRGCTWRHLYNGSNRINDKQ